MTPSSLRVLIAILLVSFVSAKGPSTASSHSRESLVTQHAAAPGAQFLVGTQTATIREGEAIPLRVGEPVTREIAGGETHILTVSMTMGQYAVVDIDWDRIDLDTTVLKPDGQTRVLASDVQVRGAGSLPIAIVAETDGEYRLQLRTVENVRVSGTYKATLSTLRIATTRDSDRFRGVQLLSEGERETKPSVRAAKFLDALKQWDPSEDALYRAYTLRLLGRQCLSVSPTDDQLSADCKSEPAVHAYESALNTLRESQPRRFAYVLMDIGGDYLRLRSPKVAIQYYQPALSTFRTIGNRWGEASALYQMGFALATAGRFTEALGYYEQALIIQRREHNRFGEARTLNAAGGANHDLGRLAENLELLEQAKLIWVELGDDYRGAIAELNIGLIHHDLGNFQIASEKYSAALRAFESRLEELTRDEPYNCKNAINPKIETLCSYIADVKDNLGEIDSSLNDPQTALEKFNDSLLIRRALKQPRGLGFTLSSIGYAYLLKGEPNEALRFTGEALINSDSADDQRRKAITLTFEGMAHTALRRFDDALSSFENALKIQRAIGERRGEAITLDKIGSTYVLMPNQDKAEQYFKLAIAIWEQVGDQDGETISRYNLGRLKLDQANFVGAREQIDLALAIIESKRAALTNETLRTMYFAGKIDYYDLDIELKMRLSIITDRSEYAGAAFQSSEKARARTFLDSLNGARPSQQIASVGEISRSQVGGLLAQKQETDLKLAAKVYERLKIASASSNPEEMSAIDRQIKVLTNERDGLDTAIRKLNPRYAALVYPLALSAQTIQQQLDANSVLLEYSLAEHQSYVWVVTPDSIRGFALGARGEIEAAAQASTLALREHSRVVKNETPEQWRRRLFQSDAAYRNAAARLTRMVLEPVAGLLGNKRLVIVPDGALQFISFADLPVPNAEVTTAGSGKSKTVQKRAVNTPRLLIEDHEIVYEPSASVFVLQRQELQNRASAPYGLAVLANPVFDKDDQRVTDARARNNGRRSTPADTNGGGTSLQSSMQTVNSVRRNLTRALDDIGLVRFNALPFSDQEARAIVKAAGQARSLEALNFDANRATATSPELSKYRMIHFATHSVADFAHPQLSGIVLSLVDEKGQPQDGFLGLNDIYDLNLPADLVVLSACQTGIGRQIRGEGLVALTRGFMYAGAQRVVASLWKVDDAATADLMAEFYQQMLTKKVAPAAALRAAQMKLSRQPGRREPYYWAGFVLQGEWR